MMFNEVTIYPADGRMFTVKTGDYHFGERGVTIKNYSGHYHWYPYSAVHMVSTNPTNLPDAWGRHEK